MNLMAVLVAGKHTTHSDENHCTFKPDLAAIHQMPTQQGGASERGGFVSTVKCQRLPEAPVMADEAKHRHKANAIKGIQLDILPSTKLRGKEINAALVDELITNPAQREYWGVGEADAFLVMRAHKDHKVEKLYSLICQKRFLSKLNSEEE